MNDEKRVNIVILGCNTYLATIFVSKMSSAFSSALTGVHIVCNKDYVNIKADESRASDFFQDWWAEVTHGAKNG